MWKYRVVEWIVSIPEVEWDNRVHLRVSNYNTLWLRALHIDVEDAINSRSYKHN